MGVEEREFSPDERDNIEIQKNRFYRHRRLRINYTTYDVRRAQDSVNPRKRRDIMLLSNEDRDGAHPYWYARTICVFHCMLRHRGLNGAAGGWQRFEFLWVRWYSDPVNDFGWAKKRLPRLRFAHENDPDAFGFINPADVVRSAHLIPAYHYGRTSTLLTSPSLARSHGKDEEEEEDDWESMYVNM